MTTVHRDTCGTPQGYWQHEKRKEHPCDPCKADRLHRRNARKGTTPKLTIEEVVTEIQWMLKLNQGSGYIIHALGYTGRETSLATRLQRNGHHALSSQLFNMEDQAA
jgi:hypothetical protein